MSVASIQSAAKVEKLTLSSLGVEQNLRLMPELKGYWSFGVAEDVLFRDIQVDITSGPNSKV